MAQLPHGDDYSHRFMEENLHSSAAPPPIVRIVFGIARGDRAQDRAGRQSAFAEILRTPRVIRGSHEQDSLPTVLRHELADIGALLASVGRLMREANDGAGRDAAVG